MSFELSRLRSCDRIVGASALAFFVFLFFVKWYGGSASAPVGGGSISNDLNGWHSFTSSRWVWLVTIAVALGAVALQAVQREPSPVQPGVLVAGLGALSTSLIFYRILHHPSGGASGTLGGGARFSYSYGIEAGIWLGLVAAAGVAYGGCLAMRDDGVCPAAVRRRASGS
jgi:hypothetical protein